MGERTKLCDYTNTPNEHFIARPITVTTPNLQQIRSARYAFHHNPRIIVMIHIT
jgi:hypothetical protein